VLHASRKKKYRGAFKHAKEIMGISSDNTFNKTVDEYRDMAVALNLLNRAWNKTISAGRVLDSEHSL